MTAGDVYPASWRVRGITVWPTTRTPDDERVEGRFSAPLVKTLALLAHELAALESYDEWLEIAIEGDSRTNSEGWRLNGRPRAGARPDHPGIAIAFRSASIDGGAKVRRYATDRHTTWEENLRAIAKGLESLRQVERYGIAGRGQQHAGFVELTTSTGGDADRGRQLIRRYFDGNRKAALRGTHPDTRDPSSEWDARDYADIFAAS